MAKKTVNIGSGELTGDGESLRSAFDKINDNFDENYASIASLEDGHIQTNVQGSVFTDDSTTIIDAGTNSINLDGTVKGHIIPSDNEKYNLGSPDKRWKDLYLSGTTLDLGGLKLRYRGGGLQISIDLIVGEPLNTTPPYDGVNSSKWSDDTVSPNVYNYDENGEIVGDLSAAEMTDFVRDKDGNPSPFIEISYSNAGNLGDQIGTLETVLNVKAGNGHDLIDTNAYGGGITGASELYNGATWPISLTHTGDPVYYQQPEFVSGPGTIPPTPQNVYRKNPDRGSIIIPVNLTPKQAGIVPQNYQYSSTFLYGHAFPVELPLNGGSQTTDVTDENGDTLVDSEAGTINADKLAGNVDSDLITGGLFNLSSDDSTMRAVKQGDSVQIVGGTGITTASDDDGIITITSTGTVVIPAGSTQSIDIVAGDSTVLVDSVNGTLNATTLTGALPAIDGSALTGVVRKGSDFKGDMTGSVFADDSTLLVDGVNGTIPAVNLSGDLPALDGSNLTNLTIPAQTFASLTSKPTTLAGYGITDGGGSGLQSRLIRTNQTSSIADGVEEDLDITGFKAYALMAITTDKAARVRLYAKAASRTADAARAEGVDPTSDAGLIAEVITTGAETVIISPGAYGFNLETSTTTNIPCRVTNKSGSTDTVQVSLLILQLES